MLQKTKGIILKIVKYSESSIIVTIYTKDFGRTAVIVNGIRSKKGKGGMALYQPLTLVSLVLYYKEGREINRIAEIRCSHPNVSYQSVPLKNTIALFLAEVLIKCLKEESANPPMFSFLENSLKTFTELSSYYQNFHVQFLIKFSKYLGFAPASMHQLMGKSAKLGSFQEQHLNNAFDQLRNSNFKTPVKLSHESRIILLERLVYHYQIHGGMDKLNSIGILKTILYD